MYVIKHFLLTLNDINIFGGLFAKAYQRFSVTTLQRTSICQCFQERNVVLDTY